MGPTFAETATRRFSWLIGIAAASVVALVALRPAEPAPQRRVRAIEHQLLKRFERAKPIRKCIDGRWVIAHGSEMTTARQ